MADLKLALTEAASNSVRHAYAGGEGSVEIAYELYGDRLVIEVNDDGEGFDPAENGDWATSRTSPREGSASRSSARSPTSSRCPAAREGRGSRLRFVKVLTALARLLQLVNVGHKSLGDYALARDARPDGRDPRAGGAARRQARRSTSPRPRSAAASPRSTTRSSR